MIDAGGKNMTMTEMSSNNKFVIPKLLFQPINIKKSDITQRKEFKT